MTIRIFACGGTFDKEYNEITESLYFKETHILDILNQGRSRVAIDLRTLMLIDSLQMTDEDRRIIVDNCKKAKEDRILITHGTGTMTETAKAIAHAKIKGKTIVLTGAMIPFLLKNTDSVFNIGAAIAFVQTMPAGIYIAMNGRCFNWDNVRKNIKIGEFEEVR